MKYNNNLNCQLFSYNVLYFKIIILYMWRGYKKKKKNYLPLLNTWTNTCLIENCVHA